MKVEQNPQRTALYFASTRKIFSLKGSAMSANVSAKTVEEVSAEVPAEDFQALEEKVYRTIELYKAAKEARATAERDAKRLREQLEEREEENESLRRELVQLRKDREDIRGRVEKMLDQMESLTHEQAAS
jgi:septal ring factor EnvC (AmiA/AmiB activator)